MNEIGASSVDLLHGAWRRSADCAEEVVATGGWEAAKTSRHWSPTASCPGGFLDLLRT